MHVFGASVLRRRGYCSVRLLWPPCLCSNCFQFTHWWYSLRPISLLALFAALFPLQFVVSHLHPMATRNRRLPAVHGRQLQHLRGDGDHHEQQGAGALRLPGVRHPLPGMVHGLVLVLFAWAWVVLCYVRELCRATACTVWKVCGDDSNRCTFVR
jgi:hypothetical protein